MKGKKGGDGPMSGVEFSTHTVPQTAKSNILSAAKKRKRGGAVAPLKVDGSMPKARLDKPKRAKGGGVKDMQAMIRGDKPMSGMPAKESKIGEVLGSKVHAGKDIASKKNDGDKPARKRGGAVSMMNHSGGASSNGGGGGVKGHGKIGADTSPTTHAAKKKATIGHSTQPNIT